MAEIKNRIIKLLYDLLIYGKISKDLFDAINEQITSKSIDEFNNNREELVKRCDLIERIFSCNNNDSNEQSEKQRQESKQLIQCITEQSYTVLSLIVKLQLFFYAELRRITPSIGDLARKRLDEQDRRDNERELLNELINAPIDDIAVYLEQTQKKFDDFFNNHTLQRLLKWTVDRSSGTNSFINGLSECLTKVSEKYQLQMQEIIALIQDKLEHSAKIDYRKIIENYVKTFPSTYDFQAFLAQQNNIRNIFTDTMQKQKYSVLFKFYCEKLVQPDHDLTLSDSHILLVTSKEPVTDDSDNLVLTEVNEFSGPSYQAQSPYDLSENRPASSILFEKIALWSSTVDTEIDRIQKICQALSTDSQWDETKLAAQICIPSPSELDRKSNYESVLKSPTLYGRPVESHESLTKEQRSNYELMSQSIQEQFLNGINNELRKMKFDMEMTLHETLNDKVRTIVKPMNDLSASIEKKPETQKLSKGQRKRMKKKERKLEETKLQTKFSKLTIV